MKRLMFVYVTPTLALLVWAVIPLVRGTETLYLRDVFNTHLEKKWVQAEEMRQGRLPLIDPYRDGGQPHLGNPNTVPLYPDNLLYLVAPTLWAFNAHFWLHLLLAPICFFALGRAWGLSREASWVGGVCYASSGFFLSNLTLFNLIGGAALAPAFVASLVLATGGAAGAGSVAAVGALWALLLLAGDPMTCLAALALGVTAVIARWGLRTLRWLEPTVALALGTLIAAPQWVEFVRILRLSFRGHVGYSQAAATAASWNPITALEWLVPFCFGLPDLSFWGQRFFGGDLPLYPTLYPGLLALLLVGISGRPSAHAARWAWSLAALGMFLALGEHNPVVGTLLRLPGAQLLRLPVKSWLLVAVGMALVCALGYERLLSGSGRRPLARLCWGLAGVYLVVWAALGGFSRQAPAWVRGLFSSPATTGLIEAERLRWAGLCLLLLAALLLMALVLRLGRRQVAVAGALLVGLHLVLQLWLLRPVLASDDTAVYRRPPDLLSAVPESAPLVHAKSGQLFGSVAVPVSAYPDQRLLWLQRQVFQELYPQAGIMWGRRYEFTLSAEGLDSFLTRATAQSLVGLSDRKRIRLLAASGVERLLLGRELDPEVGDEVVLERQAPSVGGEIWVYRIVRPAAQIYLAGKVLRAPHLNAALEWMIADGFEPQSTVVLPAGGPILDGAGGGELEILRSESELVEVAVEAPAPSALVVQRAFLPLYRATIDDRTVPVVAANIHRLGVELPAGSHRVRIWIDRRPLLLSSLAAICGVIGLVAWSFRREAPGLLRSDSGSA